MDDVEQEVADAEAEAETEMTPGDEMAEAEQAVDNAGEEMADAAENAGETTASAAEQTGDAVENAGEEAADEVAQAGEEVADETEQMAELAEAEMSEETGELTTDTAETDMSSDTGMATDTAQGDMANDNDAMTAGTAESGDQTTEGTEMASEGGWTQEMDTIFADIADQQIAELIGMDVASADGEVVGEVDNFALAGEDVVAIVGVGGFLGIGEHEVALSLGDMTYDGEKLVLSSMTEEQLREMPEYDENEANYLPEDGTLRSSYQ